MKVRGAFAVFVGVLCLSAGTVHAQGKPASSAKLFKYKGGKVETGMLYTYVRSDLAGTKEGGVLVYVPDKKRIEILRVNPGESSGQLVTGSYMDYAMPRAHHMPANLRDASHPVPATTNPLGVKGVGEAGTTASLAAIMNAIADAVPAAAHMDMPATLEKVWRACQSA